MNDIERETLETLLEHFPARMARGMNDAYEQDQIMEDDQQLTPLGRAWVQGYVAAQLAVIRGVTTGKPNLSDGDVDVITELVLQHESEIAAQLYA